MPQDASDSCNFAVTEYFCLRVNIFTTSIQYDWNL